MGVDLENFEKLLDKAEQIFGKRDNFTIDDVVKYFVENFGAKVYDDIKSMIIFEHTHEDTTLSVKDYTQQSVKSEPYKALYLHSNSDFDKGVGYQLIIGYDKDGIITSYFEEYGGEETEILSVMCKDWRERREKWLNDRMEYEKTHTLEGDLKELLGEIYLDKKDIHHD